MCGDVELASREGPAASACPPVRVVTRERGPQFQSVVRQQPEKGSRRDLGCPETSVTRDGDATRGDAARDDFAHV